MVKLIMMLFVDPKFYLGKYLLVGHTLFVSSGMPNGMLVAYTSHGF